MQVTDARKMNAAEIAALMKKKAFDECNMNQDKIEKIMKKNRISIGDILVMVADSFGNYTIVKKDNDI